MDDLYNDSKEKVRTLYDEVWSKLPFTPEWTSYMRLDMIWSDKDSAKILKDSGARVGTFGIETLHDVAGRKVGKGLGKKRILETLEYLKKVWGDDVLATAMFICGLPDEPEESILETIDWTSKTDLLDGVAYSPLWVTPPTHKSFVLRLHQIDNQNENFGIKWISDSDWINGQGLTFSRVCELAKLGNSTKKVGLGSFGHYPEYRRMGWDHQKIAYLKNHPAELINGIRNDSVATSVINQAIQKNLKLDTE
jgi:hypothetical protein